MEELPQEFDMTINESDWRFATENIQKQREVQAELDTCNLYNICCDCVIGYVARAMFPGYHCEMYGPLHVASVQQRARYICSPAEYLMGKFDRQFHEHDYGFTPAEVEFPVHLHWTRQP